MHTWEAFFHHSIHNQAVPRHLPPAFPHPRKGSAIRRYFLIPVLSSFFHKTLLHYNNAPLQAALGQTHNLHAPKIVLAYILFVGFLSNKSGRRRNQLKELYNNEKNIIIIYESVHRIKNCIEDIVNIFGENTDIIIGRELTKQFEQIIRDKAKKIIDFFSDLIYTNKTIDAVYPVAEKDGYAIYIKEYQTDNIFYASRKTNSKFKFFDNNPIVENAYLYSVNHEEHNRFSVIYIPKDNKNSIDYKKFYEGNFTEGNIITENENIISLDSTLDYSAQDIIFYTKENGYKYVYIDEHTIDLSSLGKSKGDIRIASAQYPYFYMVYYNDLFKELRISKLNVSHINIKRY